MLPSQGCSRRCEDVQGKDRVDNNPNHNDKICILICKVFAAVMLLGFTFFLVVLFMCVLCADDGVLFLVMLR